MENKIKRREIVKKKMFFVYIVENKFLIIRKRSCIYVFRGGRLGLIKEMGSLV